MKAFVSDASNQKSINRSLILGIGVGSYVFRNDN